nr:uncharacterized protein LOC113829404 [Penaeus vannamei]
MLMFVITALAFPTLTLSGNPCTVQELRVNAEPVMKTYINYTFIGPANCSSLRCSGPVSSASIITCEDTSRQLYSFTIQGNRRTGLKCVKSRGCVRLKCGPLASSPVHVSGVVRNITISRPFFSDNCCVTGGLFIFTSKLSALVRGMAGVAIHWQSGMSTRITYKLTGFWNTS